MNKERMKELSKAQQLVSDAQAIFEACAQEERDYYDNMPESLQSGEKGEKSDEVATQLEEYADQLSDIANADFS